MPQKRLVWMNSFSDPDAGLARHPLTRDKWPLQLLTTVNFAASGSRTAATVQWLPYESDDEDRRVFDAGRDSMRGGWGGTMELPAAFLGDR